ncbi:baeRF2 domain-containing protein [Cellulomonas wangsupingiae]|uniref:Peptide chain release factor 1 n=1 Tax=Cellulomonas wangsupingiae TaxID=2968085 RepID=A0ABY5KBL9_9CELL|nr:hypothetical protein [Cellulomonas wangsupingiae]MCC2334558.1 hypothetical protein [Cellulomonas wangsupingiae]MCM0638706.1 hypothetical protein [Cellulomonas wangsupingiae]UUI66475.1 hypothetical protein NP075_07145 [Cellulomonas wangsupingiae]
MHLHWLKPLLGRPGPFVTVHLDASPAQVAGESGPVDRWRSVRRELERDGVPAALLDEIADRVAQPDGRRDPHGRVLVADADGVVVDRVLLAAPAASRGVYGPVPALSPAVRATDESVCLLLVAVDRTGADLRWVAADDGEDHGPASETVDGGHDDVHKQREGGPGRRGQTRAEDSWQRNAEAVAAAVDQRVRDRHPDLVVLTGDVRAVALVHDALGQQVRDLVVEVPGGGRGDGIHEDVFASRVAEAVDEARARRRATHVERYREARGRDEGAVTGLDDVVEVLRRGQVDELLVASRVLDGALTERTLFVGPSPLHIAAARSDLADIGVQDDEVRELPTDVALLRAVVGQDAGVTFVDDDVEVVDGVGAVLRWADGSTPSESVPTQSADNRRLRSVG